MMFVSLYSFWRWISQIKIQQLLVILLPDRQRQQTNVVVNEGDNYWQRHRGHRIELHKDLTNKMMQKVPANLEGCRKGKAPDKQEF